MIFQAEDGWQAFLDECWRRASALTGLTSENQCRMIVQSRQIPAATLGEALEASSPSALVWIATHMLDVLPAPLRAVVLEASDPPSAAIIYRNSPALTDAEDETLRSRFFPFMPVARAQAEDGSMRRAKYA